MHHVVRHVYVVVYILSNTYIGEYNLQFKKNGKNRQIERKFNI